MGSTLYIPFGSQFGRLEYLSEFRDKNSSGSMTSFAIVRCRCGSFYRLLKGSLVSGRQIKCPCARNQSAALAEMHPREYISYQSAKSRCQNPSTKAYKDYGGRGIKFLFRDFADFFDCLGPKQSQASIDRIDTNGHYERGNVRWANPKEQHRNKRSSYWWKIGDDVFPTAEEAAAAYSVDRTTIIRWFNKGQHNRKDCLRVRKYEDSNVSTPKGKIAGMTPQDAFNHFCEKHGIEPTDRDFVMFLGGLHSTLDQQPVCYGYFGKDGSLLQMTEFLDPGRVSKPVPLYARPITDAPMPEIHQSVLEQVWRACYSPDDVIGFAKWVERIARASR